ncbi:N-acetylmuramoyl-L-alanine amidase, partial [Bacillus cereus]|nr:N-acetylmuramoyl-L-alanine amidase [Bacillus cereus]
MTVFNVKEINKIPFESNIIPKGNRNRPAYTMNPRYITIHTTANQNAGADARAHARYVNNGGGSSGVSWHFTVDDHRIVQHLPLNENGWHAGDGNGAGNRSSIGIEICENRDGNFEKALTHAAGLVKFLMAHLGLK